MKVSKVIMIVVALHVLVIGGIFVFEGCSRSRIQGPELVQEDLAPAPFAAEQDLTSTMPDGLIPATPDAAIATGPALLPTPDLLAPVIPAAPVTTTYTVKPGDSLWKIATTEGITVAQLSQANNIDKNSKLKIGQVLTIPAKAPAAATVAMAPSATTSVSAPASGAPTVAGVAYTVKAGDSLWAIARANNTTVSALKQANGLTSDALKVGQQLRLPSADLTATASSAAPTPAPTVRAGIAPSAPSAASATREWYEPGTTLTQNGKTMHIVDFNDSLGGIATRYGVSVQQLMTENKLTDARAIHPGQPLVIPAAPAISAPVSALN